MSTMLKDGFSTKISFTAKPSILLYEKEITPPGVDAGGPIDLTTMRQTAWRTFAARSLKTLTPVTMTVAYAPDIYHDIIAHVGVNDFIQILFPDLSRIRFYGWIESFIPNANVEGEQPTAQMNIQPSLRHTSTGAETAPDYDDIESP